MSEKVGKLRVVFAGGGTGGHIYPGIAMAQALKHLVDDLVVLFVGVRGGMDERILADYDAILLPGRGLRGAGIGGKIVAPLLLVDSIRRGIGIVGRFHPDVIVGTGGYASAAMVMAGVAMRVPRVLQEQNSVPGLVNRRLARYADHVLLSFEISRKWFSGVSVTVTGNPMRDMPPVSREQAADYFGLDLNKNTVLVVGGSRGAQTLNEAAGRVAYLDEVPDTQWLLLTGDRDYDAIRIQLANSADRIKVVDYLEDMRIAYSIADVAVARAGASSVFELARCGVPTVFVPYPYAADDHQRANVSELEQNGGCVVVSDSQLTPDRLRDEIVRLLGDDDRRTEMSAAARSWSRPDAAREAAEVIASVAARKRMDTAGTASAAVTLMGV